MCGRYTLFTPEQVLEIKNIVKEAEERLRERKTQNVRAHIVTDEILPTNLAPVLFPHEGRLASAAAFWGFSNNHEWENRKRAADSLAPLKPSPIFNTRDDKADKSPFWRESFHKRRCIVPASGFWEWYHQEPTGPGEKPKDKGIKYLFTQPGSPILFIAGIWHSEVDEATGEKWPCFSMLTTAPSQSVATVHNRMPLVLLPDELDTWVGEGYKELLTRPHLELAKKLA